MNFHDKINRIAKLSRPIVGLQVTPSAAHAVILEVHEGRAKVTGAYTQDFHTEGFLDEQDFVAHLPDWLAELGMRDADIILGIPQEVTTVQILDFPPNSEKSLDSMVGLQAAQLAELSEDSFTYDYTVMPPSPEHPVPVMVGVCLETFVNDRLETYNIPGVNLADLGMESAGLINACTALKPEIIKEPSPQLVIDMESESTTIAIMTQGQVRYAGCLNIGVSHYTNALAEKYGVEPETIKSHPDRYRIMQSESRESDPLARVNRLFTSELQAAFEQWQDQTEEEADIQSIAQTYLTGSGAALAGLDSFLGRAIGEDIEILRLTLAQTQGDSAVFTVAYGLALQGAGKGLLNISLAPRQTRWAARRKRRTGVLTAATVLLALLLATAFLWNFVRFKEQERVLRKEHDELQRCESIITQLEQTLAKLTAVEKAQIPLIEHGNRANVFADAMVQLSTVRGPEDWLIYVGDLHSFEAGKPRLETERRIRPRQPAEDRQSNATGTLTLFVPEAEARSAADAPARRPGRMVDEVEPLEALVAAGYTKLQPDEPLRPVQEIVRQLNETDLFSEVDWLQASFLQGREDIFTPWQPYLFRQRRGRRQERAELLYKDFALKLPFTQTYIEKIGKPRE